jgi:flagellar hook-associated protein FlgK
MAGWSAAGPADASPGLDDAGHGGRRDRTSMRRALTTIALVAAGLLAGCGDSAEEKAQTTVCDARADISTQVDDLKALTPATFSTDAVSKSLRAIQSDLSDMRGAQSELSDDRRQQVQDATQTFTSAVKGVVKDIGTSTTAQDAANTVTASLQQLASSYDQAFSRVDCR